VRVCVFVTEQNCCIFLFVDAAFVLYNIKCYHEYLERLKMLL